jgi:hypothetical protein
MHLAVRQRVLDMDLKVAREDLRAFVRVGHQPFGDAEMHERTADEIGDPFRIRRHRRNDVRIRHCRTSCGSVPPCCGE